MTAKPNRLQIVTQFYPPDYAPTGQLIAELSQQLGDDNTQISLFTSQPSYACGQGNDEMDAPARELVNQVHVRRSSACRLWSKRVRGKTLGGVLFFVRSALHLLRRGRRADLLLLTTAPPFLPLLGYLINRLFGLPYVCLLYDLYPDIAVRFGILSSDHWLGRWWTALNRLTWRRAKAVIVLSSSMRQHILQIEPKIADRVIIIHNWADPQRILPVPKHHNWFACQHQLVEQFTVLYSGNMGRCHDLDTIIDTAALLREEPVKFALIGGGPQYPGLQDKVRRLGLTNVLFLPYQDRATLPLSLTACDLSLVSIDQRMEGLVAPSKFYSALAAGRPIAGICGPKSYLRQLIEEAHCGQTFANGDSQGLAQFIRHLYQTPELAANMGHSGRKYCQAHFTLEVIADAYRQVLLPAEQGAVTSVSMGTPTRYQGKHNEGVWYVSSELGTAVQYIESPLIRSVQHYGED